MQWESNTHIHTLIEVSATILAGIIGVMGLLNYYTKKERIYLFIGAGFIGTFFLDGYHALITSDFLQNLMPSDLRELVPWSGLASRIFLSIIFVLSVYAPSSKDTDSTLNNTNEENIYLAIGVFTVAIFIFFAFFPLPQALFESDFFNRPAEFLPAFLFSIGLWGHFKSGHWKNNWFDYWLIQSLLFNVVLQWLIMPFSSALFDYEFNMAHLYKVGGYLCVLAGLLINMFIIFRREVRVATALTQKNEEIKAHSERLNMAMEGSNDGLLDWNIQANQIYCSPSFEKMLGYSTGTLMKEIKSLWNLIHHQDLENVTSTLMAQIKSGQNSFEMEHRMKTKDGSWKWFLTRGKVAERNDNGMALRGVATLTDITERRKVQEELKASVTRLNSLFNNVVDGIVTINEQGIIQSLNPAAEKMFQSTSQLLLGEKIQTLLPQKERSNPSNPVIKFLSQKDPEILGKLILIKGESAQNEIFSMELTLSELSLPDEMLYIGIMRDVTEKMALEGIKNDFVATVSHELRTPLTSIKGSLEILNSGKMGDVPQKMERMLSIAFKNSERLTDLINDILDLEKIEAGRMDFQMRRLDLNLLAKEAIEENKGFGDKFNIQFKFTPNTQNSLVLADQNRLLQVFNNLLSNASKFSPSGEIVEVKTSEENGMIRLSVIDKGPGVEKNFQQKLFEKFTQEDSTNTRTKGGTGLGLSISKAIIEKHSGNIGLDSKEGNGSVFYFELPHLGAKTEGV